MAIWPGQKVLNNRSIIKTNIKIMKKNVIFVGLFLIGCSLLKPIKSTAQLTLTGQVRTRTELRNGVGTLKPNGAKAAFFTSQRSRINFNYKWSKVIFGVTAQDVRVWGQDASTISNADGAKFGLHEAWAEVALYNKLDSSIKSSPVDYLAFKVGRQELNYDDGLLLGNLDWLQQARRHDAIVFKMLNKGWQTDLGVAFNQNTDAFNYNGTYYTPANLPLYTKDSRGALVPTPAGLVPLTGASGYSIKTGAPLLQNMPSTNGLNQNYKAMQFLYGAKTLKNTKVSGLFLADEFGKYKLDSVRSVVGSDTGYVFGRRYNQPGVNARFTTGLQLSSAIDQKKKWLLKAGAYYQGGKDREGVNLSAYYTTASIGYTTKKWSYVAGWDVLSGNDAFSGSTTNHRFDPLYGTPHKFWGYMDYFYVGTGSPIGGLSDKYLKFKYISTNKRLNIGADYHAFNLAADQVNSSGKKLSSYLGSEIDILAGYQLNKITTIESGFSFMAASTTMEYAKNVTPGSVHKNATWAYLQINIKPDFLSK